MPTPTGSRRRAALFFQVLATLLLGPAPGSAAEPAPVTGEVIARVGDEVLHAGDLGADASASLASIARSYARRRAELDSAERTARQDAVVKATLELVNQRVLALEAASTRRTPQSLLADVHGRPATDAELKRLYDEHAREIQKPYADIEKELRAAVAQARLNEAREAYYATLRSKYRAEVLVEPVRLAVATSGPRQGPANAPVTIVMFSDFECPFCQKVMPAIRETLARYPQSVAVVYRHLPLTGLHSQAYGAAQAAVCADREGAFWPFADALFAEQKSLGAPLYESTAARLGLDRQRFAACLTGTDTRSVVDADVAAAEELGISGTPALILNGRLLQGAVPAETLAKMVDEELARRHP
jgi:protein-disulfide isomerase